MSSHLQIDCVGKDFRLNPYQRVRRVGGPNLPGVAPPDASKLLAKLKDRGLTVRERPRWTLTLEDAIQGVLDGKWTFFIQLDVYDVANVQIATSPSGHLYLKTELDRDTPDQLLFLPECR